MQQRLKPHDSGILDPSWIVGTSFLAVGLCIQLQKVTALPSDVKGEYIKDGQNRMKRMGTI